MLDKGTGDAGDLEDVFVEAMDSANDDANPPFGGVLEANDCARDSKVAGESILVRVTRRITVPNGAFEGHFGQRLGSQGAEKGGGAGQLILERGGVELVSEYTVTRRSERGLSEESCAQGGEDEIGSGRWAHGDRERHADVRLIDGLVEAACRKEETGAWFESEGLDAALSDLLCAGGQSFTVDRRKVGMDA